MPCPQIGKLCGERGRIGHLHRLSSQETIRRGAPPCVGGRQPAIDRLPDHCCDGYSPFPGHRDEASVPVGIQQDLKTVVQ